MNRRPERRAGLRLVRSSFPLQNFAVRIRAAFPPTGRGPDHCRRHVVERVPPHGREAQSMAFQRARNRAVVLRGNEKKGIGGDRVFQRLRLAGVVAVEVRAVQRKVADGEFGELQILGR